MELLFLEKHAIPPGVNIPNYDRISKESNFTVFELKRMFCRFCTLCIEGNITNGRIDKYTFLQQPELSFCFLAEFAFEFEQGKTKAMVSKGSPWPKGLDFTQFVSLFNQFSPLNPTVKKAEYLFDILTYDVGPSAIQMKILGMQEDPQHLQQLFESSDEEEKPVVRGQVQGPAKKITRMHKGEYSVLMKNLYKDTLTLEHADQLIDTIWTNVIEELKIARVKKKILKADPKANVTKLPPATVQPRDEYVDRREFISLLSSIDLLQLLTIQL